jgi:adenylate cyclase
MVYRAYPLDSGHIARQQFSVVSTARRYARVDSEAEGATMNEPSVDGERLWREVFTNQWHPVFQLTRVQERVFKRLGSDPRCKVCKAPLTDKASRLAKVVGKDRSDWNPNFCRSCETWVRGHPGGAEIPISVLFADVRGSTRMAEEHGPRAFAMLMERFYAAGAKVLHEFDAMVDKPAGDEVRGFFLPVFARQHARSAILAGLSILRATGHDEGQPWVPVGVGVHTGTAYVGTTGEMEGRTPDITALGDAVNVTARLSARASAGELLASQAAYDASELALEGERDTITVRGRDEVLRVVTLRASAG